MLVNDSPELCYGCHERDIFTHTVGHEPVENGSCKDCHDIHSLKLKKDGNDLCLTCHVPAYNTYEHHFHKMDTDAAKCINCHMTGITYMGNDFRRDHSFRIPRPDLSIKNNVPNACNDCHSDKNYQWSENYIRQYYGERKKFNYGAVLSEGYLQKESADTSLMHLIKNDLYPEIVRATAIQYLSAYQSKELNELIKSMLGNPEPIVRESAVNAFQENNIMDLISTLSPILDDPIKIVRYAAANRLFELDNSFFSDSLYKKISKVMDEYLNSIIYTSDFPTGRFNLANYYSRKGDMIKAEKYYKDAIRMDDQFYPAKSNLALLYYSQGNLQNAELLFKDLIENNEEYSEGYYYLGLLYAEQKKYQEAANHLEKALTQKNPNPRVYYNLGLVYQYLNENQKAEKVLLAGSKLVPNNFDIIFALANYYLKQENFSRSLQYANELKLNFPSKPEGQMILNYIKEQGGIN